MGLVLLKFLRAHWLLLALGLAALGAVGYVKKLQNDNAALLIEKNNALAASDSLTTKYSRDSTVVMGILGFTRTELSGLRDSFDLKGRSQTVTTVVVQPSKAVEHHEVEQELLPGEEIALTDSVIGPPADIRATARLRALAEGESVTVSWDWDVRPRPISLTVDVGCLAKHKPDVLVRAPDWAKVTSVHTEVRTGVCAGEKQGGHSVWWYGIRAAGLFAAGRASTAVF